MIILLPVAGILLSICAMAAAVGPGQELEKRVSLHKIMLRLF